jgi:uncharacterized protein (UPF0147 family)
MDIFHLRRGFSVYGAHMETPLQNNSGGRMALGMVPFVPASTLQAEADQRQQDEAAAASTARVVQSLSVYIQSCWGKAKTAKYPVEEQMLRNLRQRNGVYEADKASAISQMGGSDVYILLTGTKCRAADAWLNDLLRPVGERPWAITPTPIPELPPDLVQQITSEVMAVGQEVINQAQMLGQVVNPGELQEELREYASELKEKTQKELKEEAIKCAGRMSVLMDDQLVEGGWHNAFWAVISDMVTLKAGILKGPVVRKKKIQKWVKGPEKWEVKATEELVPTFQRVSPFDLYPAPDSRNPNDGYLIERHQITRSELQAMIGVPGYSEENIRQALKDYGASGLHSMLSIDSSRAPLEFSGNTSQPMQQGEKIEALEFWGSVQGSMLKDWGMPGDIDPELDYEINAWKIGDYVIRAIMNPDKLGRKPYSVDSYERIPGSFWGKGIPELMGDLQDVCNSLARSIVNNAQIASGPQVEVNTDRCGSDNEELWPWKIWESTNAQMNDAPAIRFHQPQCIVGPLQQTFEFFSSLSEDQTGIPRWAYGNTQLGGAGGTSSGLSMLMTHASRGVKEVVYHADTMIAGCIERLYDYNMLYSEDQSVKGDAKIIARGSTALLAKEQRSMRMNEVLAQTNNPTDLQIMGLEGRAKLLKQSFANMDIDVEGIIPNAEGLKALVAKIEQQQAQLMAAGQNPGQTAGMVPPTAPQAQDPAGNNAGGQAANLFENQQQPPQVPAMGTDGTENPSAPGVSL